MFPRASGLLHDTVELCRQTRRAYLGQSPVLHVPKHYACCMLEQGQERLLCLSPGTGAQAPKRRMKRSKLERQVHALIAESHGAEVALQCQQQASLAAQVCLPAVTTIFCQIFQVRAHADDILDRLHD